MEPETDNKVATDASDTDENDNFSRVTTVVTGWTLDFLFVSLCRRFKEGQLEEFNEAISSFEAISQSQVLKGKRHKEKTIICAFLARVIHGKHLDVQFEDDARVMPLMSAAKVWSDLEDTVADESLFKTITNLLLVQSVAVCMEKGQRSSASSALKWFKNKHGFPQNLTVKLSTIVTQKETYHPFLMSFSFNRLLDTVQSFLDAYLEKNPSDYLLKAATKLVQSSQDIVTPDSSPSDTINKSTEDKMKKENTAHFRTKRKLMSTKITDVWKPESCKKSFVSVRRISESEVRLVTCHTKERMSNLPPSEISMMMPEKLDALQDEPKRRKPHQKWTHTLDKHLTAGVKRHGVGKWARILMDYDFEGRSGTMLKDRWRVLTKAHKAS